jgi:hypothetical protein
MEYVICEEDRDLLLLIIGAAAQVFTQRGDRQMVKDIVKFANRINEGNPDWVPFAVKG